MGHSSELESGSGHGQCAKLHTLAGAALMEGRVTAPVEVDGGSKEAGCRCLLFVTAPLEVDGGSKEAGCRCLLFVTAPLEVDGGSKEAGCRCLQYVGVGSVGGTAC